ncbi:winged helix-turn-helix domain-containing protein [Dokdonella koreensis]|uniref:OmpR/PhoB-type domain-containing protein n=1 Tax=Dokdonella koreensis DS-123 TaxID=1300342 RepID=A0A167HCF5_9GAMM|nr:winged helix-turn-helix domain-containing protein [Dokdonella koreensis]ANB19810.1 Hypothetical protein I596_3827 [Dokdonella koreensis DS-123]
MTRRSYRFGDSILDVDARQLLHAGQPVQVPAKVFDCLVYLVQHNGRAIGHDELVAAVWGKTEISESLLRQTIRRVRSVLGEDGSQKNMLRTVPGFGYQFTAEVRVEDRKDGGPGPEAESRIDDASAVEDDGSVVPTAGPDAPVERSALPPSAGSRGWRAVLGVGVLVAVVAAGAVWFRFGTEAPRPAAAGPPAIEVAAVLPVTVSTADPAWSWVRLGLMDLLATRLRSGGQLVVPSESAAALALASTPNQVADAVRTGTGARYLVVPTARRTDTGWVVRLELQPRDGGYREVEAHDADLVVAGRRAADQLLVMLGKPVPVDRAGSADVQADELLAQIKSALLRDDVKLARSLMDAAPRELQQVAEFRFQRADVDTRTGQFEEARQRFESLLSETGPENDPVMRSRILNSLGLVAIRREQSDRAIPILGEAIAVIGTRNEPVALGNAYNTRGMAYSRLRQDDLASADFARSRLASEISGNMQLLALVDTNEGVLALGRNQLVIALPLFERAAALNERLGNPTGLALASGYRMWIHSALLEPGRALAIYEQVAPKLDGLENPIGVLSFEFSAASVLQGNGRHGEARAKLRQLAESPHSEMIMGVVRAQQALLEFEMEQLQPASAFAQQAVDLLVQPDDAYTRAQAWLIVVRALRGLDQPAVADAEQQRFSAWAAGIDNAATHALARLARAEHAWSRNRHEEAIGDYEDALRIAVGESIPGDIATIVTSYGTALIEAGRLDRASAVIGRVARWSEQDFACAVIQARLYRALGQREAWRLAIDRARRLAGERPLPAGVATFPPELSIGTPDSGH